MDEEAKRNQAQLGVMMSMVGQMIIRRYNLVLSLVMRTPVSTSAIVSPQNSQSNHHTCSRFVSQA